MGRRSGHEDPDDDDLDPDGGGGPGALDVAPRYCGAGAGMRLGLAHFSAAFKTFLLLFLLLFIRARCAAEGFGLLVLRRRTGGSTSGAALA